ncbi:MAG: hypothetical protein JXA96_02330 [Sedimentisphaerales bacterium]|nr:hypothetical protein [Sedimentisphaerales bacterium]
MNGQGRLKFTWKFIAAVIIYIVFAIYLFYPYLESFSKWQFLWPLNVCIASIGCYILSRRWVAGFAGSCFAGAIYGFGPYFFGLAKFHPVTGLLAATIPWLFCPAAFGIFSGHRKWLNYIFSLMPYLAIVIFFQAAGLAKIYPASLQAKLKPDELFSLLAPLVAAKLGTTLIGFYHVPLAALILGISMLISARRYSIMILIISSIILTFCNPINSSLEISPIIWLSISALCFSIIIGAGFQGLASGGFVDRKWILANSIILGIFAIITLLLAANYFQVFLSLGDGYARLFVETAKFYLLGSVVLLICFFMTCGKVKMHPLREILISTAMGIDIFIGACFIIDKLF